MNAYDLDWIGRDFPELRDITALSSGGQKELFKCYHRKYGNVVLKIIKPSGDEYDRTIREIKASEIIGCDNVPKIFETNVEEEVPSPIWLIEQFVSGKTLRNCLLEGKEFNLSEVVNFLETLLSVSVEAEKKGIVHRDIKPENIILDDAGKYWLIDFGIARHLELKSLTATSSPFGLFTLGYAAPEQY